jgi:two-component system chemotaxis sensor kinase CheA
VLRAPLAHLVRNAIDHGIETAERRQAAGKPAVGRLQVRARYRGGAILLTIEDDGAGLDLDRIRARALAERGPDVAVDEAALAALVMEQGFSTAEEVTEISGRGVGLDAVADCARLLGGQLQLENRPGAGLRVTLEVPLTVAILDSFGVEVGGHPFFVPARAVVACRQAPAPEVGAGRAVYLDRWEDEPLVVVDLAARLGLARDTEAHSALLVVAFHERRYGLAVDRLDGLAPRIVKPLTSTLAGGAGYLGATVLGDGRVGLILDLQSLLAPLATAPA